MTLNLKSIIKETEQKNFWLKIIVTILGIFALAINYNLFLLHNNLVTGGASGISIILTEYINIKPSTILLILNAVFIIISYMFLGFKKTNYSIIGSILYPIFISLTAPICNSFVDKIVLDNFLLVVLICGTISGIATGLIYKCGFSTGGTDIPIQILNKYLHIKTGTASIIINVIIILSGAMIFGVSKAIYGVLIILISGFFVDKIMLGISDSKMFYINTKKSQEIISIIKEMHTGYTILKAEGGYSNEPTNFIMCVVPTSQYYLFKNLIENVDPKAFIIISDCYEVYGGHRKEQFPFI